MELTRIDTVVQFTLGTSTLWRYTQQGKIKSYRISTGVTVFSLDKVYKDLGLEVNL